MAGLSALALAEKAGIPYPTLRDIEAGYSGGHIETRKAIANALGCSMADLYKEPDPDSFSKDENKIIEEIGQKIADVVMGKAKPELKLEPEIARIVELISTFDKNQMTKLRYALDTIANPSYVTKAVTDTHNLKKRR